MGCILRCRVRNVIVSVKAIYPVFVLPVVFPEDQIHSVIFRHTKLKLNKANQDYLRVLNSGQKTLNTTNLLFENTTPWFLSIFSHLYSLFQICAMNFFKQQNIVIQKTVKDTTKHLQKLKTKVLRDQSWPVLLSIYTDLSLHTIGTSER